jgi:hypothetical protein
MSATNNPFVIKGYVSKEFFCDRENEIKLLERNIRNGIDTTLVSPRRMGKTGLIFRLFDELGTDKSIETLYVDIYASRDINDLIKMLAEAILIKFPEKSTIGRRFMDYLKGMRPSISFDPLSGAPKVSIIHQDDQQKEYSLRSLLEFIDQQKKTILIAIDEFQQINNYPVKNTEALLRSYIQKLKDTRFIFCGSKRSLMIDMFSNAKRPFYASTQFLSLEPIEREIYAGFIREIFEKNKREIISEALDYILVWSLSHTFYTQRLCNQIFAMGSTKIGIGEVKEACLVLLKSNEAVYFQYRQLLTPSQWNFLIALAKEGGTRQITAQDFLYRYGIGTPANAKRISESLIEKELILSMPDLKGNSFRVYDVFLSRWLEMEY